MDTRDDTISEVAATSAPRGGSDWGHLPQSDLTNLIIRAGFEVHNVQWRRIPRSGVCQRPDGRASAARRSGRSNVAFEVVYRDVSLGRYVADFVVGRRVIVETKVAKAIDPVHRAQVSNYLRASGLEVGLVLNFGSSVQFKRVVASRHLVSRQPGTSEERRRQKYSNT